MGWLVGLPLGIFRLLGMLLMLALRLAGPILLILLAIWVYRRLRRRPARRQEPREPEFDGPVYTVDYEEADSDRREKED